MGLPPELGREHPLHGRMTGEFVPAFEDGLSAFGSARCSIGSARSAAFQDSPNLGGLHSGDFSGNSSLYGAAGAAPGSTGAPHPRRGPMLLEATPSGEEDNWPPAAKQNRRTRNPESDQESEKFFADEHHFFDDESQQPFFPGSSTADPSQPRRHAPFQSRRFLTDRFSSVGKLRPNFRLSCHSQRFRQQNILLKLNTCQHRFHAACLSDCFKGVKYRKKTSCPLCRSENEKLINRLYSSDFFSKDGLKRFFKYVFSCPRLFRSSGGQQEGEPGRSSRGRSEGSSLAHGPYSGGGHNPFSRQRRSPALEIGADGRTIGAGQGQVPAVYGLSLNPDHPSSAALRVAQDPLHGSISNVNNSTEDVSVFTRPAVPAE